MIAKDEQRRRRCGEESGVKPAFEKEWGTVTAANSSSISDGDAARSCAR